MISLGSFGDISGVIGTAIGLTILSILLFTLAPTFMGAINQMYLESQNSYVLDNTGERFDKLVKQQASPNQSAEKSWLNAAATDVITLGALTNGTAFDGAANKSCGTSACTAGSYFTPSGTAVTLAATGNSSPASTYRTPRASTGQFGQIVVIIFQVAGLFVPIGAMGFLTRLSVDFGRAALGGGSGSGILASLLVVIGVVVVALMLPIILGSIDDFYNNVSSNRFAMYSEGIGTIARVLGNFFVIAFIGGLAGLGSLLFNGRRGVNEA